MTRRTHITPGMVVRRINTDDEWRTVDKVTSSGGRSRTVTFTDGTTETVGTGTPWEVPGDDESRPSRRRGRLRKRASG